MRRVHVALIAALAASAVIVGCATTNPNQWWIDEQRSSAHNYLDKWQAPEPACRIGTELAAESLVLSVGPPGYRAGIRRGDRILEIGGRSASSADGWIPITQANHGKKEVPVAVERDGRRLDLITPCVDSVLQDEAWRDLARAVAAGDWPRCVRNLNRYEETFGRTAATAGWRSRCNDGRRLEARRPGDLTTASLVYDFQRLSIEEAEIAGRVSSVRADVMGTMKWLRYGGFDQFAKDLENQLAAASGERPGAADDAKPRERGRATGTCFGIDSPGLVATASHVVEGATSIAVRFDGDEEPRKAKVRTASKATDLAVLEIEGGAVSGSLSLADEGEARSGDKVFTVGHPVPGLLGKEPKFTEGVISGMSGLHGEAAFMQISVPVQPGNSGGPVVREDGLVVGVVSSSAAVLPFIEATGSLPQDVNWAASAEYLRPLFQASGPPNKASSRAEAIEIARRAVCSVEARR